jgi:hypothetical protein
MAKKSNKIIRYLNTGIFPGTVMFSCGFDYDFIIKFYKKHKATDWLSGLEGDKNLIDGGNYFSLYRELYNTKTGESKHLYYIILKKQFTFTDYEMCVLAHEIVHICQFFLKDILDRNKEIEAEAYLHTHLMQQCLKELRG